MEGGLPHLGRRSGAGVREHARVGILGCLLTPIKQSIQSTINSNTDISVSSLVCSIFEKIEVDNSDFFFKAEVYYFSGLYNDALSALTKEIGTSVISTSFSKVLQYMSGLPRASFTSKYVELCSYLLYYTKHYKSAIDYINWLKAENNDSELWPLLAAHCQKQIGDYKAARQLLNEVSVLQYTEFRHFDIQTWTIKSIASFSSEKHSMITLNSLLVGRERCIGDVKEKN